MPEGAAVNLRRRSYKIVAAVEVGSNGAEGVLFAHGGRFGGHSLFVKDHKLHYVYNWLGETQQNVVSDTPVPSGKCALGVEFEKTGDDEQHSSLGTITLYINDQKVGTAEIKTQPGKFMLGGDGLNIGKDLAYVDNHVLYGSTTKLEG